MHIRLLHKMDSIKCLPFVFVGISHSFKGSFLFQNYFNTISNLEQSLLITRYLLSFIQMFMSNKDEF